MFVRCHKHLHKKIAALIFILSSGLFLFAKGDISPVKASPTNLFFSEYIEGSGYNKALEIFNGTGAPVDLSTYTIELYSNGAATPSQNTTLSGILADGDVFVIAYPTADAAILAEADATDGAVVNFNGDDTVVLRENGTIIDAIGQIGFDPGAQWGVGEVSTQDNTIRRRASIETGDSDGNDPFDPALEWQGFPQDTFDDLGQHIYIHTPPTVIATTPGSDATGVSTNTTIILDFSENVTVVGQWFSIICTTSGDHTVTISWDDQQYTLDPDADFTPDETCTVTIFASQVTDQDGTIDPMEVDFTFSFTTAQPTSGWIINEIHADPDATIGDANDDGIVDTSDDEFVEIINSTGNPVDISGWTLNDATGPRHTFPPDTLVPDQCAIVIFGGGTPTGTFGEAIVQTAGTLGLNNGGDTLTLNDGAAAQTTYTYGNEGGNNQSLTRDPDLTGPEPLVLHSTATGAGGTLYSPGTRVDGTPFDSCIPPDLPPTVATTVPDDTANNVLPNTAITIQFREIVNVTGAAFTLECPAGMPIPLTIDPPPPGNTTDFSLIPAQEFPYNTVCMVSVSAAEVADQDGVPNNMTADYFFAFTTTTAPDQILISEFLYDGLTPTTEGDEFIQT